MSFPLQLSSSPWFDALGWTLVHSVWQGAAVLVLLRVVLMLLRRSSPNARYIVATAAMGAMLAAPVITFAWIASRTTSPMSPRPVVVDQSMTLPPPPARADQSSLPQIQELPPESHAPASPQPADPLPLAVRAKSFLPWLTAGWIIGVLAMAVWHLGGWLAAHRLRSVGVSPIDGDLQAAMQRIAAQLGVRRSVKLLQSTLVGTPIVIGWLRPVILVPASCLTGLPPAGLEAILAHELAHVRRHDYIVNLLQCMFETLLFYHPAVWWISATIREEREHCCDDVATAFAGSREAYAQMLTRLEELRDSSPPRAALAAAGSGPTLQRIRRMLDMPIESRNGWWAGVLLAVMICAGALLVVHTSPVTAEPSNAQESETSDELPPLPEMIRGGRFALRVMASDGKPVAIQEIIEIRMQTEPLSSVAHNQKIRDRFADGWVIIPDRVLSYLERGQRIEITFEMETGDIATASGEFPNDRRLSLELDPTIAFEATELPVNVADEEIAGQVVNSAGQPVAGATVSFPRGLPQLPPYREPATTGADGVFRIPDARQAHFLYMEVTKPGYATQWITDAPIGRGFRISLDDTTRFIGQLFLPDGAPASNATLTFVTEKPKRPRAINSVMQSASNTLPDITLISQADEQGKYDVLVEPGRYDVRVESPSSHVGVHSDLRINKGQSISLPERLQDGARFHVRVLDSATGNPIAGARLAFQDKRPYSRLQREGSERITNNEGRRGRE